jgi:hypothetical protein
MKPCQQQQHERSAQKDLTFEPVIEKQGSSALVLNTEV